MTEKRKTKPSNYLKEGMKDLVPQHSVAHHMHI